MMSAGVGPKAELQAETPFQVLQRSGLFDDRFYIESNPDVAAAEISPLEHFFYVGAFEGRRPNPLFDPAYYLATYPEVGKAEVNPALHYFTVGAFEGRDPSPDFDTRFYLTAYPDVARSGTNPLVHFLRLGSHEGRLPVPPERYDDLKRLRRWARARRDQAELDYRPLVSLLMPTYNTPAIYLEAAVQSVIDQAYPNWELRIVDDGSSNFATLEALDRVAAWDGRIFFVRNDHNRGISSATNDALRSACGEFVAMLDHDDELTLDALYEVVLNLNSDRTTDVVYTDQDYMLPSGKPDGHFFKPDWSPALFRGVMYIGHLLTVRRSLALEVGGFDSRFDLVQDFEFMLRVSEQTRNIRHVPKVLYHRRKIPESVAGRGTADRGIEELQVAAVQAHLGRLRLKGYVRSNPRHPYRAFIEHWQTPLDVDCDLFLHGSGATGEAAIIENPLISTACQIIRIGVPDRWSGLESLRNTRGGHVVDVADGTGTEADRLSKFLAKSSADFVLAMSANVAIESEHWIELLAVTAQEHDVAAVCPLVLSVDGRVAHAGLTIASNGSVRPSMCGFPPEADGYAGSLSCAREVATVWAEVVLLRRSAVIPFLASKPTYATADFLVADLALRATRSGLRAICVPYVTARRLMEIEADGLHRLDARVQQDIWAGRAVRDRFYNPNFTSGRADYS
jgi:glycosyltransferase involved in cell wall biosynthesis